MNQPHMYIFGIILTDFLPKTGWKRFDFCKKTFKIYTTTKTLFLIKKIRNIKIYESGIEQKQ